MATTPPAPQPNEFDKWAKAIRDLDARLKRLDADAGFTNIEDQIQGLKGKTSEAIRLFQMMSREAEDLENVFQNISTTIKNVVADLDRSTKSTTLFKRGLNNLEGLARKLADHKSDENVLTVQQLKNITKQVGLEKDRLRDAQQRAITEQAALEKKIAAGLAAGKSMEAEIRYSEELLQYQKEVGQALFAKNSYIDKIVKHSQKEIEIEKEIQRTVGLTGMAFKGIAGTLQTIGVQSEALESINLDIRKTAKETGSAWKTAGTAIKSTFGAIKDSLSDPAVQLAFTVKVFKSLYQIGAEFSAKTFEIQKALGLSTAAARDMNEQFYAMQQSTNNLYANYNDLITANLNLNEALGTSATFSADVLATQAKIAQVTGLTSEESAKVYEYSLLTGESQEQVYDSMGKINKGVLSNKKVMQEVLKIDGQLAAQYKNQPKLLGQAVVQAQKLGITLEQAKNMASNLLNFEDSISAELEAELLTGQELNLEKARALALQGKTAEAAQELLRQTGGLAKFQRMNVLQQDALARSMGMTTDELANSLVKAKQLQALDASEAKALNQRIQKLKEEGETEKAAELEKQVLQGKTVALAEQELDAQSKIDKAVDSIKSSLKSSVAPLLGGVTDRLASVLATMAANPIMKAVLGGVGIVAAGAGLLAASAAAVVAIKNVLFGSAIERKQVELLKEIRDNTAGGGIGGGGSDSTSGSGGRRVGGRATIGKQLKTLVRNPRVMGRALRRLGGGSMAKGLLKSGGRALLKGGGGIASLLGGFALDSVTANQMAKANELQQAGKMKEAEKARSIGKATDVGSAALTGAGLGATIGSIIPGLGTAVGAGVGGLLGAGYGAYQNYFADPETAEDFILRPGQKPLKFRKDDVVVGGTNLGGTNSSGNTNSGMSGANVEALLKDLIVAVNKGHQINVGANKLNEINGLSMYSVGS